MNENEAKTIVEKVKELVAKGNVSRIVVRKDSNELVNIPVNAGLVGGAVALLSAKWLLLAAVLATVGFGCTVTVVKDSGEEVSVLKEGDAQKVKDAAAGVVRDVKDAVIGKAEDVAADFEEVVSQDEEEEHKPEEEGPSNEG